DNASAKAPRHASPWQWAPTEAASSAIAGIGSTTPCGYWGAAPTTSAVRSSTAAAIAATSAVQSSSTGVVVIGIPYMWAALWNAACAEMGTTIVPNSIPRSTRARWRAASTAHWIDSVPPLVRNPAAEAGPLSNLAVQPTTSDWISPSDGKARVLSALSWRYIADARSATS